MKKVVLYIAISLDGYIADTNGGVNWLAGDGSEPENMGSYNDFYSEVSTVVLGYKTYHQIVTELSPDNWVYSDKKSYVVTHREIASTDNITFTGEDIGVLVERLKTEAEGDIWICGGAHIANQLLDLGLIDRLHIAVAPIILGDGTPLFNNREKSILLKLEGQKVYNGFAELIYSVR